MKRRLNSADTVTVDVLRQAIIEAKLEGNAYSAKDLIVCRKIDSVFRSLMAYDAPYRIGYTCMCLVTSGSADVTLNLVDYHYEQGMFIYCRQGSVLQMKGRSEQFEISVLACGGEYLRPLFDTDIYKCYLVLYQERVLDLKNDEYSLVSKHFTLIASHIRDGIFNKELLSSAICTFVYYMDILCRQKFSPVNHPQTREEQLFQQFIALVNQNSRQECTLDFYASKLCITIKHLCWTIKRASGKTAKEWIDRARLTDAKEMLK